MENIKYTLDLLRSKLVMSSLGLLTSLFFGFAQQSSIDIPDYHPVSPNAASLGNYGLYPVNKNLGNTTVNIPVYTLTEKNLTVPITLNYNMSGIRLNDLASWVGLGWSLNAGGAIIRNTKGLPDLNFFDDIPAVENLAFNQTNWDYFLGAAQGSEDTAPDEYVFNALGINGSFYFDRDKQEAVFDEGTQIKITVISKEEVHAILADGSTLIFGKNDNGDVVTEMTNSNLSNLYLSDPLGHISAWYLTKLISKDRQHSISFEYKTYSNQFGATSIDDYSRPVGENIRIDPSLPVDDTSWRTELKTGVHELSRISKKYLDKIIFENGYIQFESSLGREDLQEDFKLDAVKVYTNDGTPTGKLLDEFHFTYDKFIRSGGVFSEGYETAPVFFNLERQVRSREFSMKLTSLYRGPLPTSDTKHTFEYNESTNLPLRCTTAQDFWGYPNNNTGTLLPRTQASVTGVGNTITHFVGDGDRNPNEEKMKAGVLEKITYPTGGSTVFQLEANRISTNEQVYVSHSPNPRAIAYGMECDNEPGFNDTGDVLFDIPQGAINIRLHIYMSPVASQGQGTNSSVSLDGKYFYRPGPNSSGGPSDSSDGLEQTIDLFFGYNLGTLLNPILFQPGQHTLRAHDIGIGGAVGATPCSRMMIFMTWDEPTGVQSVEKLVGGLRIKSISNYDGKSSTPVRIKKFEYENPNLIQPQNNRGHIRRIFTFNPGIALISRVSTTPHFNNNLGGEPIIEYGKVTEYDYSFADDDDDITTPQDNGKVISYFQNIGPTRLLSTVGGAMPFQHPQFSSNFVYTGDRWPGGSWNLLSRNLMYDAIDGIEELTFYESTAWKRGKLSREETYKRDGDTYILINEVDNLYETITTSKFYNNFIYRPIESTYDSWIVPTPYDQEGDFNSLLMASMSGETELGRRSLKQSIVKQYDTNGQNPITNTTNYFYDNPKHLQLTRTETINSKGENIQTKTFFPDDVDSVTDLGIPMLTPLQKTSIDSLKKGSLHRISEPIQVETTINGEKTTQRTGYRTWYVDTAPEPDFPLILPDTIKTVKGIVSSTNPMQNRVIYQDYDINGDPRQFSKADGPSVSYIWGYNKTLPIAKFENATFVDITTALASIPTINTVEAFQSISDLDNDRTIGTSGNEGALRAALNLLRDALPNAMVSTYTYDPLIGVTSMTDPKGYTMYYIYDSFNRLKEVRDADNNIITDYKYHFKGQDQ